MTLSQNNQKIVIDLTRPSTTTSIENGAGKVELSTDGKIQFSNSMTQVLLDENAKTTLETETMLAFDMGFQWKSLDPLPYYVSKFPKTRSDGYVKLVENNIKVTTDIANAIDAEDMQINGTFTIQQELSVKRSQLPSEGYMDVLEYAQSGLHAMLGTKAVQSVLGKLNSGRKVEIPDLAK